MYCGFNHSAIIEVLLPLKYHMLIVGILSVQFHSATTRPVSAVLSSQVSAVDTAEILSRHPATLEFTTDVDVSEVTWERRHCAKEPLPNNYVPPSPPISTKESTGCHKTV